MTESVDYIMSNEQCEALLSKMYFYTFLKGGMHSRHSYNKMGRLILQGKYLFQCLSPASHLNSQGQALPILYVFCPRLSGWAWFPVQERDML